MDHTDDPPITESTSETTAGTSTGNYSSENSILQIGEGHALRGLSPDEGIEKADLPKPSVGGLELNRIYHLLITPGSAAYRAYERHREGNLSLENLAGEVCLALTGSRDQLGSYVEPVRRMVDEFAMDDAVGHELPRARDIDTPKNTPP